MLVKNTKPKEVITVTFSDKKKRDFNCNFYEKDNELYIDTYVVSHSYTFTTDKNNIKGNGVKDPEVQKQMANSVYEVLKNHGVI